MSCEVWSLTSRELMHSFGSRAEAVLTLRQHLDAGDCSLDELAIVMYDASDVPSGSVSGMDLMRLDS